MQELLDVRRLSREHPRTQCATVRPALDVLVSSVAECFGVSHESLRRKSRDPSRKALAQLAVEEAGVTVRCIADWMGVSSAAASKMREASRRLYERDPEHRETIDRIRAALS